MPGPDDADNPGYYGNLVYPTNVAAMLGFVLSASFDQTDATFQPA